MRRGTVAVIVLACGLIAWFATRDHTPPNESPAPVITQKENSPPAPRPSHPPPVTLPIAVVAADLNSPDLTAEDDLATLASLLDEYRRHFAGNPVGDNDEITAALLGANPKGLAYLPVEGGAFLDPAGRLIDRWGTPYFFHALSARQMEIQSAGPDREFHTEDDIRSAP